MTSVILMYHRIVERPGALPWFERGTAVTPAAFVRQMEWLVRHFEVVPVRRLLREERTLGNGERPRAAITFDDGYRDVVVHALPTCQALGIIGTVFPVCGHQAASQPKLWFDELYLILQAAFERLGNDARVAHLSLNEWVRGEVKQRLQASTPEMRSVILRELARELDVGLASDSLYLLDGELEQLARSGWSVGGHGVTHSRLTMLSDNAVADEVRASLQFARSLDADEPLLAYPDGAVDARVLEIVRVLGVRWAFTVEPMVVRPEVESLSIPRFLCRGEDSVPSRALAEMVALAPQETPATIDVLDSRIENAPVKRGSQDFLHA